MADDETTRIITRKRKATSSEETKTQKDTLTGEQFASHNSDEDSTRLFSPRKRSNVEVIPKNDKKKNDSSLLIDDPVVGWVVVVDGPGKGNFAQLGHGMNSIGRTESNRIALDYGDEEISRDNHAFLTYDPKGKKFFIQHGGGKNLTYVENQPVLQPREIFDREQIVLGNTKLYFVGLCGDKFEWE
jgi:hypothetical protein